MTPGLRKFTLTTHVTSSVGLLGAIAGFLALAVAGLISHDSMLVRAAYVAMDVNARFVIVPFAFAALLTGVVQSLGTPWGLLRHYWVLAKLLITAFATTILLLKMVLISDVAAVAAKMAMSSSDFYAERMQLVVHAGGGFLVLLVPAILSVYKPPGMTRYGARKQRAQSALPEPALTARR
jgi:hypothetical protein